jgi:hypothetical protein
MRLLRTALALSLLPLLAVAAPAPSAPPPAVPDATVTGPVTGGLRGHPWYDPAFETASVGYVEEEFFLSGTARALTTAAAPAAYTTRVFVVRPKEPKRFNGTVVVEWDNVTAQAAFSPMFTWTHRLLLREGYAFASVSAQAAGVCCAPLSHKVWDPVRYQPLSHPGDDYSFDVFAQSVKALRAPKALAPLGPLKAKRVLAVGNSQSASRLHTWLERVQAQTGVVDGVILDAGGSKQMTKPPLVPTVHLLSEDGIDAEVPDQLGSRTYRLWEVPGASHNDAETARHIDFGGAGRNGVDAPKTSFAEHEALHETFHYGEEGPGTWVGCQPVGQGGNEYPRGYAVSAALHQLDRWVRTGVPAGQPPRVRFDDSGAIVRDAYGHPLGGLRLPPLDVPVARYLATTCGLFGQTVPLSPTELSALYPTHDDYVAKVRVAVQRAVRAGWLLPPDAAEHLRFAERSAIPAWR